MSTRAGFVALIGEPNAGKSTLLNRMVGAKVSIVTHKVQTTRARIRGVALEGEAQIVFVDTPGIFRPKRRLDRAMVKSAWGGAADADLTVFLIEAHRGVTEGVDAIMEALKDLPKGKSIALAINKIDKVQAAELLALTKAMNEAFDFVETFLISAEKGHGCAANLLDLICVTEAWPLAYLHWEMQLLEDLGFGLDLSCCAVSGATEDLAYVSPKSGRAVAAHHAGRWKTQLLPLVPCMIGQSVADNGEIAEGLRTTGYFLEKWLAPSLGDRALPSARKRLVERLFRAARLDQRPSGEANHE